MSLEDAERAVPISHSKLLNADRGFRCCVLKSLVDGLTWAAAGDAANTAWQTWFTEVAKNPPETRWEESKGVEVAGVSPFMGGAMVAAFLARSVVQEFITGEVARQVAQEIGRTNLKWRVATAATGLAGVVIGLAANVLIPEEALTDLPPGADAQIDLPKLIDETEVIFPNPTDRKTAALFSTATSGGFQSKGFFYSDADLWRSQAQAQAEENARRRHKDRCERCIRLAMLDQTGPRARFRGANVRKRF